jgi:hypothetical protein
MPNSGRIGRAEGTRKAVVPRTPYIVVYRVSSEVVEVVGIWHRAREWPSTFWLLEPNLSTCRTVLIGTERIKYE